MKVLTLVYIKLQTQDRRKTSFGQPFWQWGDSAEVDSSQKMKMDEGDSQTKLYLSVTKKKKA